MKRLVRFRSYYSESLKKSLADAGIKYEWTQEKPDPYQPNYLIFHLDIDAPEYELILKAIDDAKLRSAPTRTESLSFTKKELDDAEWLHVRPSCKKIDLYGQTAVNLVANCCQPRAHLRPHSERIIPSVTVDMSMTRRQVSTTSKAGTITPKSAGLFPPMSSSPPARA